MTNVRFRTAEHTAFTANALAIHNGIILKLYINRAVALTYITALDTVRGIPFEYPKWEYRKKCEKGSYGTKESAKAAFTESHEQQHRHEGYNSCRISSEFEVE